MPFLILYYTRKGEKMKKYKQTDKMEIEIELNIIGVFIICLVFEQKECPHAFDIL